MAIARNSAGGVLFWPFDQYFKDYTEEQLDDLFIGVHGRAFWRAEPDRASAGHAIQPTAKMTQEGIWPLAMGCMMDRRP